MVLQPQLTQSRQQLKQRLVGVVGALAQLVLLQQATGRGQLVKASARREAAHAQLLLHKPDAGVGVAELHWQCLIYLNEELPLPLPLQAAVYRLAQEVAQNVIKHARARHATLEVETLPGWLVLRAEDDGQGFEPGAPTSGSGLKTLRHRVVLLGGTVHLTAVVAQGTRLQIRIPLPPANT